MNRTKLLKNEDQEEEARHYDDDDDDHDHDDEDEDDELAQGQRLPRGGERAQRDNCPYVHSDLCRRDSELGQMLMTCGKLSSQAPSVKSSLNGSHYIAA